MEYDDLKFMNDDVHEVDKGNFHLDTEVRQAGLTRFDIEQNLQVQLRFDGLDEAHILLGESGHCEDHWGSGFCRQDNAFGLETTSHNIAFSSSGANTYKSSSLLRPINVWSEATSSESVQMLLNSIQQDEVNLTTEGNLFGPDFGELTSSSDDRAEVNMWSVSKGSKRESLHSRLLDILGDEFENTSENKHEFENTGKKNQLASEQSVMDLREDTKELPILSNFSEQCGSLFAVNSSSVMDCRPAENKYVPMIGVCFEVNKFKQDTHNLAPNKDSIPQVNAGNEDLGFQTEGAEKSEDEMLLNSPWAEETERMGSGNILESRDRREGKRGKHQSTVIMTPERRVFDPFVQSQHEASIAFGQVDIHMSDSVWDEGDGGSQKKQLDRVSQEDILSPEMQELSELCSYKRDENSVQEASQYGFMILNMKRTEDCTSNEKEEKLSIGSKNWMEAGNKRGGDLCPFMRIEKRLDNATLDVSSHHERNDFKHTQIQGMPDFLLHENKKENVEEQFIEPYEDCVAVEELSGVSEKGAKEAIVGVAMKGIPESLLDESNQTCSVVSPEDTVLADIEEMPDLIFDVSKEDQTTMHAKGPSQQDHLPAKMQGVLDQLVDGEKQCTSVGCLNNLDASDNTEGKMCEFSRNKDRSIEEARENNTVNGSSHEAIDVLRQTESHWVSGSVVKHVQEQSLENVQKAEMRGGLDNLLDERSEYAGVTAHEDIAFVNVHRMLELVIDVNDETDVEMHATQVDCKNPVTEAVCSVSDFMLDEKKKVKGRHDLCDPGDEEKEKITKYPITGDFLNVETRICNMGRSSQEKDAVFGCAEIQRTLKSLVGGTDIDNSEKHSTEALQEIAALVEKQGVLDFTPCKSIVKNAMSVEKIVVLDLSLDETAENDVRMHTTYALDEAAATVNLQRMPLYACHEKNLVKHSEASEEEMEEMPDRLAEKYEAGKNFIGACQDAVLESPMQGMSSSILDEGSQSIPQKHAMESTKANITMVEMQDVLKPLVDINENPHKQDFEGLQENHLDEVQLPGHDNEQTVANSLWILQKSQTVDVLTKGKSLTKFQDNSRDENNVLLKESGSGYKNVKEVEFPVIDVEMENNNEYVRKRKTPEDAQVSVTEMSASLSQREKDLAPLSSLLAPETSENMAHTYNEKPASSMEKAGIIYMDSGTSGFMASEVREPEDISRLHVGVPTAFVSPRTTSVDTVLHNKDITEPSKDNFAHRKPLSAIQGHEVQEDGHASPHEQKASLENHLFVASSFYVSCNSNSPGCEEAAVQTLQVLPLANLQAEKACDQSIDYHNSGSQIVKALGTDFVTLQNVQDLNVSLLTESEKFDKSVIANMNESGAVNNLEIEKNSTSIESLPFHKESVITACRQAMQIAKTILAVENGDIDKNGSMAEECEKNEKVAQLTPEATYHQKLNNFTFPVEKIMTDGYQQAMQSAHFSVEIVDGHAKQIEHSNLEFQNSGEAVVISMDMDSDHTRQTGLMNQESEESDKAVGTSAEIEDDLAQPTSHMNPGFGENVEVTRTSIEIQNSFTKYNLMNLESEHSFKTTRTGMKIENDNYEKACLINQESEISVNLGCTVEATAQDGGQPKSCSEQCIMTSDSGNPSTQGGGKLHYLENLEKDVKEATKAGLYVPCMTGKVFNKDEKETEKDNFKVKTSEISLESVSSAIGECALSQGGVFPGDGEESANECDLSLVQYSCQSKDGQVGAERHETKIQPLGCLKCKDAEVESEKFEAGIQQYRSMSQSQCISTVRVHSGKVFSEGSRKSPSILPNSEHEKPLKARQPNEISQNNVLEDLTECRRGQPEDPILTKTFQNEVENNGTGNSVVCELHSMPQKGNYYQTASEGNKEERHLVISLNELDRSSNERPEMGFCITVDGKAALMNSENRLLSITLPSSARLPDINKQCPLLSNVSTRTLSDLNTTAVPVSASIQQPFTDSQQLQLRAQILVYGSLIQGSLPEESLMTAAFGNIIATCSGTDSSNHRENLWEQSWRLAAAKIQVKICSNACEAHTPKTSRLNISSVLASTMFEGAMQTVSPAPSLPDAIFMGTRSVDLAAAKSHCSSSRLESSHNMGRVGHMNNPSAIMSLTYPFSSPSPVWTMPTPIHEGVQLTSAARNLYLDSPQITPSRHISLIPQLGKYAMGSPAYWTSCSPSLPWVTPRAKSESELSFSPFVVSEPIHETLNDSSSVPLFVPYKMTTPPVPSVSSTMIGTTIPFVGTNDKMEAQKGGMGIERQLSVEQRPRKRRKSRVLEEIDETSRLTPARLTMPASGGSIPSIPLPTSQVVLSQGSLAVARNSHDGGKSDSSMTTSSSMPFVPSPSYYRIISRGEGGHRVIFSEETASCIEQARLYAEEAASSAATAVKHSQFIWSQLVVQEDSRLSSDCEAKLVSAAAAASAAASVAKAAAAAAKVAHEAGLQAKLMAAEALNSNNALHGIQSGAAEGGSQGHQRQAIHKLSSITKERQFDATPCLLMSNGCHSIDINSEAGSAATKRAQNLDAIERAAGIASEAVSQAGAVIAMGDPVLLSLNTLLKAGPDGYWKLGTHGARVLERYDGLQAGVQLSKKDGIENSEKSMGMQKEKENKEVLRKETLRKVNESVQDSKRASSKCLLDDSQHDTLPIGEDCEAQKDNCLPDPIHIGMSVVDLQAGTTKKVVRPEDEPAAHVQEDSLGLKSDQIRDGSLVEVVSHEEGLQVVWFLAKVLSLQAGKALVRYNERLSDDGSVPLQEWIPLKGDSGKAPRIRMAHHMIAMKFEATRKRRREAMGSHVWSVGDHVEAWIHDGWWEGIITGISEEDENGVTVNFSGKVDTLLIKAWNLRPSLVWKDGQWIEWTNSNVEKVAHEDGVPLGKRQKVDKEDTVRKEKSNNNLLRGPNVEEGNRDQELSVVMSSAKGLKSSAVKISREGRSAMNSKARHAEQTEASRFHELPKPAKKKKIMDVSRHYFTGKTVRNSPEGKPTNKMDKYKTVLSHSQSGLKTNKFEYLKAKKSTFSKPSNLRFGKEGQNKAQPEKDKSYVVEHTALRNTTSSHEFIMGHTPPISTDGRRAGRKVVGGDASSLVASAEVSNKPPPFTHERHFSAVDADQGSKRKASSLKGSSKKSENIFQQKTFKERCPAKIAPGHTEPRRSNRKFQPSSRLLEGLQSSPIIGNGSSTFSHEKGGKAQSKTSSSISKGNTSG